MLVKNRVNITTKIYVVRQRAYIHDIEQWKISLSEMKGLQ